MFCVLLMMLMLKQGLTLPYPGKENNAQYWKTSGREAVTDAVETFENINKGVAKNIIMVIGDGMSLGTTTAGRVYMGQKQGNLGEEHVTELDRFPHVGLAKTYSLDHQTPDSASTGTAILCGVKTRTGMIGMTGNAKQCDQSTNNHVYSALEKAIKEGKSTGIVTNTRVQHATPAASYAHITQRRWYSDRRIPKKNRTTCKDIAMQLFEKRLAIQVILGGGRSPMRPNNVKDEEFPSKNGERLDGRNLIKEWKMDLTKLGKRAQYVWNKEQFMDVDTNSTEYLLGLFNPYEMKYKLDRFKDVSGEPSLSEMVQKAIKILSKNPKGYFLLVEGGLLDKAHHQGLARYALQEFVEVDNAIKVARAMTSEDDTLFLATADHGHMFTFGGGAVRGNPVMGLAMSQKRPTKALDHRYFTSIIYGNGPGYSTYSKTIPVRKLIKPWEIYSKTFRPQSAIPLSAATHSAEDVVVYASGPMSHLIHGVNEQSYIAHVMFYAACLGEEYHQYSHCQNQRLFFEKRFFEHKMETQIEEDGFEPEAETEDI